ncbi:hypothetical protein RclHR1_16760005 [Rhizophagus clarus]|uniref:Uncharacterized protein n=1 Tax=Rhizophagus clarus TaxID=94130 RepID=A0A2Z6QVN1_9GLOM|nr:hypothetical protein RclHR1_16760005 [Rhizophagus clarus]
MEIEETEDDLPTNLFHQQRLRRYTNQQITITKQEIAPELFTTDEESSENNSDNNNDNKHTGNTEIFKDYSLPDYEPVQDQIEPDTNTNMDFAVDNELSQKI